MGFFDVLRHEADLRARITLVIKAVDWLTIVGLADLLDVFFEALVGEKSAAARRGGRRRVARHRTGALGDVREELGHLKGIGLLLLGLIVEGLQPGLLGLLLRLTGTHLGLRTSKASLLCIGAEACEALRDILQIGAVCLRGPEADTLLLLGSGKGLIVILLVEGRDGLRLSEALLSL